MVTFCHVTKSDTGTKKVSHHHNSSSLGLGVKHGFKESVQCSPGRYELSLLLHQGTSCEEASGQALFDDLQDALIPLALRLLGQFTWDDISLVNISFIVATPDSIDQGLHAACPSTNTCPIIVPISLSSSKTCLPWTGDLPHCNAGSHVYTVNLYTESLLVLPSGTCNSISTQKTRVFLMAVDKSCFHILLLAILVVYGISLRAKK